jgi:hypothetical protein
VVFFCQFTERNTAKPTMLSLGMCEHIVRKIPFQSANYKVFFHNVGMAQNVIDQDSDKVLKKINNYGLG